MLMLEGTQVPVILDMFICVGYGGEFNHSCGAGGY